MTDDAAGAVGRTPRPAPKPPAAWWSPTEGFWSTDTWSPDSLRVLDFADEFRAYPPPDAVQLVGPDQRRPVVLLRAEDCDCGPPYADCEHGPEPVDALDLAVWLHAELQHKLALPCGSCHPCLNWADETWRRAGRKPPTVGRWEDKLAEAKNLDARLDDAITLIEEMSNHIRQDPALAIGVETRLAALRADEPTGEVDRA